MRSKSKFPTVGNTYLKDEGSASPFVKSYFFHLHCHFIDLKLISYILTSETCGKCYLAVKIFLNPRLDYFSTWFLYFSFSKRITHKD